MNKHSDIDTKIIAARPESAGNSIFIAETMKRVKEQSGRETFSKVIRTTNVTKKERLFMKVRSLSTASLLAVIAVSILAISGTAYAAYSIFNTVVDVEDYTSHNDNNKQQYNVNVKNCGKVVGGTPIGNGQQAFEVSPSAKLSEQTIQQVISSTCDYQSAFNFANKQWSNNTQQIYKKGNLIRMYGSVEQGQQTVGTITALSDTSITIKTTIYQASAQLASDYVPGTTPPKNEFYPEGKTVTTTLPLAQDAGYYHSKTAVAKSSIGVGDKVFLQTVSEQTAMQDSGQPRTPSYVYINPADGTISAIGIIKVDFDSRYVQSFGIGNPAFVAPIVKLVGCQTHKNKGFLCLSTNSESLRLTTIYGVEGAIEQRGDDTTYQNGKDYFRKDIPNAKLGDTGEEAEGRVVSLDHNTIRIRSRGKAETVKISLPYDVVSAYNAKAQTKLKVGDYLQIYYNQLAGENNLDVKPGDIVRIGYWNYERANGSTVKY